MTNYCLATASLHRPVASKVNVTEEMIRCLISDVTEQRQKLIKYPLKIS
jgi:hypothetical protein